MKSAFAKIAFTATVQAMQKRAGSFSFYNSGGEEDTYPESPLGPNETAFIEEIDSFYMATVSETGWPYVQHRGGPMGFLKVLDENTIGYAEFEGNRQYVSVGNLAGDQRVCLILMNYPLQRRLKIFGRARVVEEDTDSELMKQLDNPHYRARVERGMIIHVEGYDWNCPKYITPRYSEMQIAQLFGSSPDEVTLEAEIIGQGELELTICGVKELTPRIKAFQLRAADWSPLPEFNAGAHLELPVRLENGSIALRQFSLMSDPHYPNRYEIAVLCEPNGRGGSLAIHKSWQVGTRLRTAQPSNFFKLHMDSRPTVFIAGGIGITPIREMARVLKSRGSPFQLHFTGRSRTEMAYLDWLSSEFEFECFYYFSRADHGPRLDVDKVMKQAPANSMFYVCGPNPLIDSVINTAKALGIPQDQVIFESFI